MSVLRTGAGRMNVGDIVRSKSLYFPSETGTLGMIIWSSWSLEQTVRDIKEGKGQRRDLWSCKVLWNNGVICHEDSAHLEVIDDEIR